VSEKCLNFSAPVLLKAGVVLVVPVERREKLARDPKTELFRSKLFGQKNLRATEYTYIRVIGGGKHENPKSIPVPTIDEPDIMTYAAYTDAIA